MNEKLKFILIATAIIIILIGLGVFLTIKGFDKKIPLPIKNFTVCQGSYCVDSNVVGFDKTLTNCLNVENNMTFCGSFSIKQNK